MREHRQRDVAVPAVVAPDLVLVQADLALGGLEGLLDGPAGAGDAGQLAQRGGGPAVAQVVGAVVGVGQAAAASSSACPMVVVSSSGDPSSVRSISATWSKMRKPLVSPPKS